MARRFVGIDPSTKTGICILDESGNILDSFEATGKGNDPGRMVEIIETTIDNIEPNDLVMIEGFGFASQSGFLLGGIGWGIRTALYLKDISYKEAAPTALKKFASGKGTTKKDELAVHIFKHWGFEHKSDNVRDAYVLARLAEAVYKAKTGQAMESYRLYQQEVIQAIISPKEKVIRKKKVGV